MESLKNNSVLPDSWINVEWSEITTTDGFRRGPFGGNLKKSCFVEEGYSVYEQYAPINDDCTSFRYFIDEEKYQELSGFHVNEGDFLISCSGTIGRITHVPYGAPNGVINQALLRIRLQGEFILPEYFLKLFRSPLIQNSVLNKTVGGAIQNLAAVKELKTILLPLAPLPEQKRIVEKLDSLLAQVEIIQQRLNNLPDIIKRFRQSVLSAAVSGKLTEQWRARNNEAVTSDRILEEHKNRWCDAKLKEFKEKNKLPKNDSWKSKYKLPEVVESEKCWVIPRQWAWTTIDSISFVTKLAGFEYTKFVEYSDDGDLPVIKAENVGLNGFRNKRYSYVFSDKVAHLSRSKILGNEILVVFVGAGVGQVGIVPDDRDYFLGPNVAMIKNVSNLYLAEYLEMYLRSLVGKKLMLSFSKGAAQPSLSMGQIRKTSVPIPPLSEQTEIVRLVEQYFGLADTLEKHLANAKARVDNLTQSILAKAFRGELVPQDPNDEPADKLLERIKAARLEAEKLEKAAKKAAKVKR
jgi:type I restriction enzyme S subunit